MVTSRKHARQATVRGRLTLAIAAVTAVIVIAGCAPAAPTATTAPPDPIAYRVLGGIEQIYVLGAQPGDHISISLAGSVVGSGVADRLGSFVLRKLIQGSTYSVLDERSGDRRDVRVLVATENPPQSSYDAIRLHEGLNYVPMRDGITLAATVRPPIGMTMADAPFPTVVEYSGYQIAAPDEPLINKIGSLIGLPADQLAPGPETDVGSLLVRLAGFAVVSVQMRGTGCSGGEGDLFDQPTNRDGYDIVEAVAAQPFVSNHRVGMVGISFSGFSQIATAATHPPHLAAIAPLSFVGSLYDLAHPGGIFNDGFAKSWMAERVQSAHPAPDPGALPYANVLVQTDAECRYNQRLRLQTRDGDSLIRSEDTYTDEYVRRDFRTWMKQIDVPTFAALQFQDEETSAYALLSAQDLLNANDRVWLNVSSGHHRDAVTPETMTQLMEFLDIYVAQRPPQIKWLVDLLSSVIFGDGSSTPPLPDIWASTATEAAKAFEATPRVHVLLELPKGANEHTNSGTRWRFTSSSFPVPGSTDRTWYLGADGSMNDSIGAAGTTSYHPDPAKRRDKILPQAPSGAIPTVTFTWSPVDDGDGVGFVSSPLTSDIVAIGPAAANIMVSSSAADTDLGLTLSEVRPDGQEMLVSTGVQRASMRSVDPATSTATRPAYTLDHQVALPTEGAIVPVQILPVGHVFRAGSRIRLSIAAVGGDREKWAYESVDPDGGTTTDTIHLGGVRPSSLTLTLAPNTGYPATLPPCPSSGQPCRPWHPALNGG